MKKLIYNIALMGSVLCTSLAQGQVVLEALDAQPPSAFSLPSGVSIEKGKYIVASTYDTNYLPFSSPTQPATWDSNINPDTTPEAKTLDFQGKIPAEGVLVRIPITVTSVGSTPTIPAYSQTINIPAWKTQDGISRDLTLEWQQQTYNANTKFITARLKPSGLLNVKKLDLNAGLGNDYQGVEVGTFTYAYNYIDNTTAGTSSFEVRALAGIPDRNFGRMSNYLGDVYQSIDIYGPYPYDLIYLPIEVNGKIWLNNNLGAAYNRTSFEGFDPSKQATSGEDGYAYGNIYQWQRPADGHDLKLFYVSDDSVWRNYPIKFNERGQLADSWVPNHYMFIIHDDPFHQQWNANSNDGNYDLWKANGSNNPCPYGFHVPTMEEWETAYTNLSKLKLPNTGGFTGSGMGDSIVLAIGNTGYYWSSIGNNSTAIPVRTGYNYNHPVNSILSLSHMIGLSIRCIQD